MSSEDANRQFTAANSNNLLGLNSSSANNLHSIPNGLGTIIAAPISTPHYDHNTLFQSFHPALFDALQSSATNGFSSTLSGSSAMLNNNNAASYVPNYLNNLLPTHSSVNLNLSMTIQPLADNTNVASHATNAPQHTANRIHSATFATQPLRAANSAALIATPAASSSSLSPSAGAVNMADDPIFLFTLHFVSSPSSSTSSLRRDHFHYLSSTRLLSSPLSLTLRQFFECSSRLLTMSRIWLESDASGELYEYGRKAAVNAENAANSAGKDERKKKTAKKNEKNTSIATDEISVEDGNRRLIELAPIQEKVQKLVNSGQIKAYMHAAMNLTPIHPYNDKRKRKTPVQRAVVSAENDDDSQRERQADIRILRREQTRSGNGKGDGSKEEKMQEDPDSSNQRDEDEDDDVRSVSPSSSSSQQSLALSAFSLANVYIELLPTMKECRRLGCVYFMENNLQKSRRCCFYCQSGVELSKSLLRCYAPPMGLLNEQNMDRNAWNEALEKCLQGVERDFWKFTAAPADERSSSTILQPPSSVSSASLPTMTTFGGSDGVLLYFMFVSAAIAQATEEKFASICQDTKLHLPGGSMNAKKNSLAFRKVPESSQFFLKMKSHFWTFEVHSVIPNPNVSAVSFSSSTAALVKQISVYRKIGKPNQNRRRSNAKQSSPAEKRVLAATVKHEFTRKEKKNSEVRKGKGRSRDKESDRESDSQSENCSENENENEHENRNESQKKRKIETNVHTNANNANTVTSANLPGLFFLDSHDNDLSLQLSDRSNHLTLTQAEEFTTNLDEENERSSSSESENSVLNQTKTQMHNPFLHGIQESPADYTAPNMHNFLHSNSNDYSVLAMLNDHSFFQSQQQMSGAPSHNSHHQQQSSTASLGLLSASASAYHSSAAIAAPMTSATLPSMSSSIQDDTKQHEHELFFTQHEHSHSLSAPAPAPALPVASTAASTTSTSTAGPAHGQTSAILSALLEPAYSSASNSSSASLSSSSSFDSSSASSSSVFLSVPVITSASLLHGTSAAVKHEDEKRIESDSDEMESVDSSFHSSPNLQVSPQSSDGLNSSRPHSVQPPTSLHLNSHTLLNENLLAQSSLRSEVSDNHLSISQPSYSLLRHQRPVGATLAIKDVDSSHGAYSHLASVPVILLYRDAATLLRELDAGGVNLSAANSPKIYDGAVAPADVSGAAAAGGFVGGTFQHIGEVRVNVHAVPEVATNKKKKKNKEKRLPFSLSNNAVDENDNDDNEDAIEKKDDNADADGNGDGDGDDDGADGDGDDSKLESKQAPSRLSHARRSPKDPFIDELRSNRFFRFLLRVHLQRWSLWLFVLLVLFSFIVFFQGTLSPSTFNSLSLLKQVSHPEISSALAVQSQNSLYSSWMQIRSSSVVVDSWVTNQTDDVPASTYLNQVFVDRLCDDASKASAAMSEWIATANSLPSAAQPLAARLSEAPTLPSGASIIPSMSAVSFCSAMNTPAGIVYLYRLLCSSPLVDAILVRNPCNQAHGVTTFSYSLCLSVANFTRTYQLTNSMFLINLQPVPLDANGNPRPSVASMTLDGNSSILLAASNAVNFYAAQVNSLAAARASYDANYQLWAALPQLVPNSMQVNSYILLLLQIAAYALTIALLIAASGAIIQVNKCFRGIKKLTARKRSHESERLAVSAAHRSFRNANNNGDSSSLLHERAQPPTPMQGPAHSANGAIEAALDVVGPGGAALIKVEESKSSAIAGDNESAKEELSRSVSLNFAYEESMNEVSRFISDKQKKHAAKQAHGNEQEQQAKKDKHKDSAKHQQEQAAASGAKEQRKLKQKARNQEIEMATQS